MRTKRGGDFKKRKGESQEPWKKKQREDERAVQVNGSFFGSLSAKGIFKEVQENIEMFRKADETREREREERQRVRERELEERQRVQEERQRVREMEFEERQRVREERQRVRERELEERQRVREEKIFAMLTETLKKFAK